MPLKPYDHTTYPATGAPGSSAALRAELELIEQGFDALALALENAITGSSGSATLATTKASEASASATSAQTSATNAASSAASALANKNLTDTASATAVTAANNANTAFQSFDVRYLGSKATAPTLDNNGQALASGAMYFDTTLAVFRGYTGSTWVNLPATTAGSISYTAAGGLTSNNVQAAITELATTKVGYSGSNLLSGRLVVGNSDPNNFGRLGTTNATFSGVFAVATDTSTVAIMQATTSKVSLGSYSNHPVSLKVNNIDIVDVTSSRFTFNGVSVGVGVVNTGELGQLLTSGSNYQAMAVKSTDPSGASGVLAANSFNEVRVGSVSNHPVDIYVNNTRVMRYESSGNALLAMPTGVIGYATAAGGSVTQVTSKSTAVTLNRPTGQITMNNASLAAGASVLFNVNNTLVSPNDLIVVQIVNNTNYIAQSCFSTSGAFGIRVTNITAGPLSESVAVQFAILRGSIS